ncbi:MULTISPECIES: NAD(P)-dependent oxidoreductase [unclassified Isoptericola]|uniref:NAD(P)-dependent oxidoreductase n=1 Tax=unclassified Isoptericola TaxID=2623355 RepID=UPI00364C2228
MSIPSAPPRVLVVDPAPGARGPAELRELRGLGVELTVNVRRVPGPERAALAEHGAVVDLDGFDGAALVDVAERASGFDAVKFRAGIPLDATVLGRLADPSHDQPLRVVGRAATGMDTVDAAACRRLGIEVLSTPGANAAAVAEHTLALMLDGLRGVTRRSAALHAGRWAEAVAPGPARGLAGRRVGLVGAGATAREVARLVRAFGASVVVLGSPRFTAAAARERGVERADSLSALIGSCDVVSLHVPLTASTRGMIGAAELEAMRPGSLLVDIARGGIVDERALDAALRDPDRGPSVAALDVFEAEGDRFASPLVGNPHAILTPHVAGMTAGAMVESSRRLVAAFARFYGAPAPVAEQAVAPGMEPSRAPSR